MSSFLRFALSRQNNRLNIIIYKNNRTSSYLYLACLDKILHGSFLFLQQNPKHFKKILFFKVLKINVDWKKCNFSAKKSSKCFCSSKNRLTFVLAFGNKLSSPVKADDPWQHSIQTSSTTCPWVYILEDIEKWSKERKTNRQIYLIYLFNSGRYRQFKIDNHQTRSILVCYQK